MSRKRLALLGAVAVVVVAGVAFLVLSDDFPPTGGLTGAIGGVEKAERYRDAQVTADDVKVYDAEGYDQDGFDRNGLNRDGVSKADLDKGDLDKASSATSARRPRKASRQGIVGDLDKSDLGKAIRQGHLGDLDKG